MILNEVLQALDELATRYEETARALRAVRIQVADTEFARERAPETDGGVVTISEAIRRVLVEARGRPMEVPDVWDAIRRSRIPLKTRSRDPRNLIGTTLQNMRRSRQVDLAEGGWILL